ncbi:hypothetical protein ACLO91_26380 [Escherichia coli]|uniref:hypothetical protein n=1 Tax=Escherichia coli TaxID=562 RepID=UPI003D23A967
MITTRHAIKYYLKTGRDVFDDYAELDKQQAKLELGEDNSVALALSNVLEGLDAAGLDVDNLDLESLMMPTVELSEDSDDDEKDFIPDPKNELFNRAMGHAKKGAVSKTITALILSKNIMADILLDAPYDMAITALNDAATEQERQLKK